MTSIKKIIGLIIGSFTHIASGLVISYYLAKYFNITATMEVYLTGLFFSLILPDSDGLWMIMLNIFKKRKIYSDSTHKFYSWTHYPLITLSITGIIYYYFSSFWALLAFYNFLSHYLIDSAQSGKYGVGIQWLAPINKKFFRFFKPRVLNEQQVRRYILTDTEWCNKIILNPKYPELWINIAALAMSLVIISN